MTIQIFALVVHKGWKPLIEGTAQIQNDWKSMSILSVVLMELWREYG